MVRQTVPRRAVLALTGSALFSGCLTTSRESTKPTQSMTKTDSRPAVEGSWPQLGQNAGHSGYNPTVPATYSDLRWKTETEGPLTTPTVVNDRVYITRGKPTDSGPEATLEAYNLNTGKREWVTSLDTSFVFHAPLSDLRPIYHDGVLYLNIDEKFVAIDADTRETLWRTSAFKTFINDPPVVTDDAIYGAGFEGLSCFEHDGSKRWTFTPNGRTLHLGVPSILDDTVYTTVNGDLTALETTTGKVKWRKPSKNTFFSVIVTENEIIQAGDDVLVSELDGTKRWQAPNVPKASIRPAVGESGVFLADHFRNVVARELDSGDARWKTVLKGDRAQGTMPTVTDGAVNLLRSDEENITMYSLNAVDGKTTWQISRKGNRGRGPIPARDTIVFTTQYTSGNQGGAITVSKGVKTTSQLWAFNV
ncbi:outer membrane protein assembly factor BamB family protein [Haladaptatus sp. NG-SE-30]